MNKTRGYPVVLLGIVVLASACGSSRLGAQASFDASVSGTWGRHEAFRDCLACHGEKPDEAASEPPALVEPMPALCVRCHGALTSSLGWAHGPFVSGQCLFCHTAHKSTHRSLLAKPVPELCTQCHETKDLAGVPHHSEVSYTSCLDCHRGHASPHQDLLKDVFLQTAAGLDYLNANGDVLPRPIWMNGAASLKGLRGVAIVPVIKQSEPLKAWGITDERVQTLVAGHLREHRIPMGFSGRKQAEQPELQITLRLMPLPSQRRSQVMDLLAGSVRVSLRQPVRLLPRTVQSEAALCLATTWETGGIVRWTTAQATVGLEQALNVLVLEFCRAYREVNQVGPRQRIQTKKQ